tara:strand:+ start:11172 stop:13049 length:1878 start_codon:yes stop_codon:yes gene_type:complete
LKVLQRYILIIICTIAFQNVVWAQIGNEFQLADRLMKQQRYESALDILTELVAKTPNEYYYFDRLIECYVQLKRYDDGLGEIKQRLSNTDGDAQVKILEAKLYHFKGDTTKAYQLWNENLKSHPKQYQLYMNTARSLSSVRAYTKAVDVYKDARVVFNNKQLFLSEIAESQMLAGNYEGAILEWLNLLKVRPEQRANIQRLLLRYNDPLVYDITMLEIEDEMNNLSISDPIYKEFYEFQTWLLQENKLYRRALATSIAYESATSNFTYSVFNLGKQLLENKEFELSSTAYSYYIEHANGEIKWRSMEELAGVYAQWAKQLQDFNLNSDQNKDSLFSMSFNLLTQIRDEAPSYSRIGDVILKQAEIALDHTYNHELAERAKTSLSKSQKYQESAELYYLEGRIQLIKNEFTQARIAFTKSNKKANIGPLAEKTRYFLALTDFFSGDYEFANIQLKSLGRQNTSYYANDALELRLWIQKGTQADTTGELIKPFADAIYFQQKGDREQSTQIFEAIVNNIENSPFKEDAFINLARYQEYDFSTLAHSINTFLEATPSASQRERLMWERAAAADQALNIEPSNSSNLSNSLTTETVIKYYEEILLDYPLSFYAPHIRNRLSDLSKPSSS